MIHSTISKAADFKLTDAEYDEFTVFLTDKEYDYTTKSEKLMDDLKKSSEEEKNYDAAKAEYDALKSKLIHSKKEDLKKYKDEIKELLEEEIASRYYYQKGRLEASVKGDNEVGEAIKILNDVNKYKTILTTIEKPKHPFHSEKFKEKEKDKTTGQN